MKSTAYRVFFVSRFSIFNENFPQLVFLSDFCLPLINDLLWDAFKLSVSLFTFVDAVSCIETDETT
jgi:hypothetical protein